MQTDGNQDRITSLDAGGWLGNRAVAYLGVAICSGMLSLYRFVNRDIINGDGILYIDIAKAFLVEGVGGAFDLYPWPFYGILIGLVHKLTSLSYENSAFLLNTLLLMLVCVMFVRIYEEISGKQARILIAVVLVLALPVLNGYREFVIRGPGFWACMLLSVFFFIQYSRSPSLKNALKWQLGIAAAILFRLEGIAFLVLAPFYFLFFAGERSRLIPHFARLNSLFILLAVIVAAMFLAPGVFSLPPDMGIPVQMGYISPMALFGSADAEAEAMFARNRFMSSADDARLMLASGVMMLISVKVVSNAVLPYLAVWGYGVHRKWLRLTRESWFIVLFAATGFLTLIPVAGNYFFLSSRYTVFIVLLISLITIQYVDYLLRELHSRKRYKWSLAAWVVILVLLLDGVISGGAEKENIRVAGKWLLNAEIPAGEKIACNEARLEYYSGNRCNWTKFRGASPADAISNLKKEGYTNLLFWISRKDRQLRSAVDADAGLLLVKEFPNKSGNTVGLYRIEPGGHQ